MQDVFDIIVNGTTLELESALEREPELIDARNEDGTSLALFAVYARKLEMVRSILLRDPKMNEFDFAAFGRRRALERLLDSNGELLEAMSSDGFTLLHIACFCGQTSVAEMLLERGARADLPSANPMAVRPIHSAATRGATEICELLLDHGADPDAQQAGGWTALHTAANTGNRGLAKLLIARGANIDRAADEGKTALQLARDAGHEELIELLS